MSERTITIATADYGPVTVPEPEWCSGVHPGGLLRAEIGHEGARTDVMVSTFRGPRRLLELMLWQDAFPAPTYPHGTDVYVVAHLLDGDHFGYDVAGLEGLAADLMEAATQVRRVARRLGAENQGDTQ